MKITREFRDAECRERTLQSIAPVKKDEDAEKSREVYNSPAVREDYNARLAFVRQEV